MVRNWWSWKDDALCAEVDTDLFFPEVECKSTAELARRVCRKCPVARACLAEALLAEQGAGRDSRHGIWGGSTGRQRYDMERKAQEAGAA